jgi:hypothetical protein
MSLTRKKIHKESKNMPRISTEERERIVGMLQTGCGIRVFRLWKHPMLVSIIQVFIYVVVLIMSSFTINSLKDYIGCTAVAS